METSAQPDVSRTRLEAEVADQVLPDAQEAAARFTVVPNLDPATDEAHEAAMEALNFGTTFGDYMAIAKYQEGKGWYEKEVVPYGPLGLTPAAAVLHYSQEIFEGLKAFRWEDGSVWVFRPGFNSARLNRSADRLAMPNLPLEDFIGSLVQVVRQDERWVPAAQDSSLYLRPFMIADEPFIGIRPAHHYIYSVISSPVGPYFKNGLAPVSIWVSQDHKRAAPGGTGGAKTGGNYAASLLPQQLAQQKGFEQVCYLDAQTGKNLEELGGMNVFVVKEDGSVLTPALTGTILEGGTRSAIIQLLADRGIEVQETTIPLEWLTQAIEAGEVTEMFACGTAAIVTPIGRLGGNDFDLTLPGSGLAEELYAELSGIQRGTVPDRHGWMYQLV